jgi:cob(I)alamin adenosyltransferase
MSITTKTGDKGKTSLANGERTDKSDPLFHLIGNLDELSSWIGLLAASINGSKSYSSHLSFLLEIQHILYIISAELVKAKKNRNRVLLPEEKLTLLEKQCQKLETELEQNIHQRFLYPGGCELAAKTDIARAVCRRAERSLVHYSGKSEVRPLLLAVCNRLSDYLYLLRCHINQQEGVEELELSYQS